MGREIESNLVEKEVEFIYCGRLLISKALIFFIYFPNFLKKINFCLWRSWICLKRIL